MATVMAAAYVPANVITTAFFALAFSNLRIVIAGVAAWRIVCGSHAAYALQ